MDEKIGEIEFDILPLNYLNPFRAIEHIKYLLSRINKLENAIDRHEIFKRTHEKVVSLEDEELYQTRKEE
jgi:hypothetical protein